MTTKKTVTNATLAKPEVKAEIAQPAFFVPRRFNQEVADDGIWTHNLKDDVDNDYGRWKVKPYDPLNPIFMNEKQRIEEELKDKGLTEDQIEANIIARLCVIDSELPNGEGGFYPHSTEFAIEYLTSPWTVFAMLQLVNFVVDPKRFLPTGQELPEKN